MSTGVPPTLLRSRTCDNPFSPLASLNPTQRLHTYIGNDLVLYCPTQSYLASLCCRPLLVYHCSVVIWAYLLNSQSAQSLASVSSVSVTSHSSTSSQTSTNPQPTSTQSKTSGFSSPTQTSSGGGNSTFSISTSVSLLIICGYTLSSISSASVVSTNSTGALVNIAYSSSWTLSVHPHYFSDPTPSSRRHGTWAIAVGVSVVLLLLGLGAFFLIRRRKGRSKEKDDAFESPHTIYPHVHAPVVTQNTSVDVVPPLYPNDVFAPSAFRGTAGSMMTAPTNSDEVYYNRVVMGGSGGYLRANDTSS
ncbi:uncharacterized protein EI90DRAFT_3058206 [Cantharellus anzutake]|uniref:uncharacterized protein n=1 Tax=Cantharellus anzutake TaxID=1750568 RepID=UPI00190903BE|nr:uncharacterized protein EI90DRAFT_3058206 [Cantharellus anzutake]KAF8331522.1 hypothetical protein EI90DRAFT_3058206 [Cantharellus anzutake]